MAGGGRNLDARSSIGPPPTRLRRKGGGGVPVQWAEEFLVTYYFRVARGVGKGEGAWAPNKMGGGVATIYHFLVGDRVGGAGVNGRHLWVFIALCAQNSRGAGAPNGGG